MAARERLHLSTLQAGRAVAALMVVLYHIQVFLIPERLHPGVSFFRPLAIGYSGVEFFFALSGFLMAYIHARDIALPERGWKFMAARISRIYPAYLAVVIPLFALWWSLPDAGPENMPADVVAYNLTLLPTNGAPLLEVAWTLQFEMMFYVFFSAMIFAGRVGIAAVVAWFVACVVFLFLPKPAFPWSFLLSEYNLIFLFGALAALFFRRIDASFALPLCAIGLLVMAGAALSDLYGVWPLGVALRTVALGFGAALIITGLAAGELNHGWSAAPVLKLIGDASYSIYLIHMPFLTIATAIFLKLGFSASGPVFLTAAILLVSSTLAGVIFHRLFERPLSTLAKRALLGANLMVPVGPGRERPEA